MRRVSEAGASELAVPSTKACHTHGSAGVGRGGCFAGTSPEIIPDISPPSRCRRFGMPENQKIRKPQRLRDSRSSKGFMDFATSSASVASGNLAASSALTGSEVADAFADAGASETLGDFAAPYALAESVGIGDLVAPVPSPKGSGSHNHQQPLSAATSPPETTVTSSPAATFTASRELEASGYQPETGSLRSYQPGTGSLRSCSRGRPSSCSSGVSPKGRRGRRSRG